MRDFSRYLDRRQPRSPERAHRSGMALQSWLWAAPAKHSTRQIAEVLERIAALRELKVNEHLLDIPDAILRRYARRLASRPPAAGARIKEPVRTVEVALPTGSDRSAVADGPTSRGPHHWQCTKKGCIAAAPLMTGAPEFSDPGPAFAGLVFAARLFPAVIHARTGPPRPGRRTSAIGRERRNPRVRLRTRGAVANDAYRIITQGTTSAR